MHMMVYKLLQLLSDNSVPAPLITIHSSGNKEHYELKPVVCCSVQHADTPTPHYICTGTKNIQNISKTSSNCLLRSYPPSALNLPKVSRILGPLIFRFYLLTRVKVR